MSFFSFLFARPAPPRREKSPEERRAANRLKPPPGSHIIMGMAVPGSSSATAPRCSVCGAGAWGGKVTPRGVYCKEHADEA